MAHADYNCCAVCDCKLDYNAYDARCKQDICTNCLKDLRDVGAMVLDVPELMAWIASDPYLADKLKRVGYSKCFYENEVDDAVAKRLAPSESQTDAPTDT